MNEPKFQSSIEKTLETLKKDYVVVSPHRIKPWQAYLVLGVFAGIVLAVGLIGNKFGISSAASQFGILGYKITGTEVLDPAKRHPEATITISRKQGDMVTVIGSYTQNPYNSGLIESGVYTITSSQPEGYEVSYVIANNANPWDPSIYTKGTSVTVDTQTTKFPNGLMHLWWRYTPLSISRPSIPNGVTSIDQTSQWTKGQVLLKNFVNMYNADILYDPIDTSFPYKMWFFGWAKTVCNHSQKFVNNGCDAIFFARSINGDQWQVYSGKSFSFLERGPKFDTTMNPALWVPVITAQNKWYDQWHNGDPSVVKVGNTYFMSYSSTGFDKDGIDAGQPGDTDGAAEAIMGATSIDGINWKKRENPLLVSSIEYGSKRSPEGVPPDDTAYARPSLLYENGKFKIWFDYWYHVGGGALGYAELPSTTGTSADFLMGVPTLIRSGSNPSITNFTNPAVIHIGSKYYAYADPPQYYDASPSGWQARKIVEAVSSDGINWEVTGLINPESGCAADHVPQSYSIGDGKIYLTYGCQKGGDPYDYTYKEIRRMSKKL